MNVRVRSDARGSAGAHAWAASAGFEFAPPSPSHLLAGLPFLWVAFAKEYLW